MSTPRPFTRGDRVAHPRHGEGVVREAYTSIWVHFDKDAPTRGYGSRSTQYSCAPAELELIAPSTLELWERLWAF